MSSESKFRGLHLVVFSEQFYPDTSGGAHTRWLFAHRAVERGAEVTVFTMRDADTPRSETVNGVEIKRPVSGSPSFIPAYNNLSLPFRLVSSLIIFLYCLWWFNRRRPDAIHSSSYSFHWAGKILATVFKLPLTNFMGYTPSVRGDDKVSLRRFLEYINFKYFMGKTIFCRTPEVRNIIESTGHRDVRILHGILNKEKIMNISDIDSKSTRSEFGILEDDTLIVFVGRLVPIKQPSVAVDIVGDLQEKYRMLMIGDGPEREQVEKQIRSEGLLSRITLTGELSHDKTLQLIKSSDVLLLTSDAEAYPTVVFEALALGSTVVAPPVGILSTIEHPRLHISNLDSHLKELQRIEKGSSQVQQDFIQKYSIERYTIKILVVSQSPLEFSN